MHIAIVRQGTNYRCYFDHNNVYNFTRASNPIISPKRISVGLAEGSWAQNWVGKIRSFKVSLGLFGVSGTAYEYNGSGVAIPGAYPVYLYRRATGVLVASTMSGADGAYTFDGLISDEYYVMALDNTSPIQRSAIVDKVVPS
jgi:hypothetical protein